MATSNATYVQRGEALDYTNSTEAVIPAGSVISLTTRIGVAGTNIDPGAVGSIHVVGVFSMDKTDRLSPGPRSRCRRLIPHG